MDSEVTAAMAEDVADTLRKLAIPGVVGIEVVTLYGGEPAVQLVVRAESFATEIQTLNGVSIVCQTF